MSTYLSSEVLLNIENISQERLDGEVIVISFNSGKYFSTSGAGADIFYLIQNQVPQELWFKLLSDAYGSFSETESGIETFLEDLKSEGIIVETQINLSSKCTFPDDCSRNGWVSPRMIAFNDLQDLLLIDPIHDSSIEGWPQTKNE
jgi:hypothetical protein